MSGTSYRDAGVDLDKYRDAMQRLPALMRRTFSPRVLPLEGGFAGLFQLDFANRLFSRNYDEPVLVACTDGVGTKLRVAQRCGKHDTVGIDLVAMCVNDAICCGAEPLFFLDYVAMSHDDPIMLEQIVRGISDGCRLADCALLGGETAIMPDIYQPGDYDLAGFCVGVAERKRLIDGKAIAPDDVLLGVASSGIHSNGFSLVRKIIFDIAGLKTEDKTPWDGQLTIGQALLQPTRIYTGVVRKIMNAYKRSGVLHGVAHITGGGLQENIDRILPKGLSARIEPDSWERPPVFSWLQELGGVADDEMARVFNMGVGLVLVLHDHFVDATQRRLNDAGWRSWRIGRIMKD